MVADGREGRDQQQPSSPRLRFGVLGSVRAWRGDTPLDMGSPQQRALVAALLLRRGRTVTARELTDGLWGQEPPERAVSSLRTYAHRLRKALGPDAGLLTSVAGGYALRLAGSGAVLDVEEAAGYAEEAEKAAAAGDRARARELYGAALAQWDGEALAGIPGPYAEAQRVRLTEWRLELLEQRIDLDLQLGTHAGAVSELTALTAAYPLRERLRELLMLALYRNGRQAEALAVYADTRRLLADELGVDPRPELSALHQRILQADDSLAHPAEEQSGGEGGPAVPRPAQLPATVADFTGRGSFVAELSEQLATAEGRVMAVSAVAGIGGVGKTTLAVHVAHAARGHFPDGQLYVDLQGAGSTPTDPEAVLGTFLRSLGTPDTAIPDGLDERAALFRSTLDGRRVLALLDNARDAGQVRPLLPGTPGCAALVTSRARMAGLAGAQLVDLDVMSPDEAMELFTRIVGAERVTAERDTAMDVVAACGFLPLAIRIAASRLAGRRTWTVAALAAKLADQRRRLDELRTGDLAVRATFQLGYAQLEPAQARAFRLLGLADGPDISLPAAAAVLDLDEPDAEALLESMVDTSLLESAAPGRYRFHDLVRLYARDCAERDEASGERAAALSRLLDFYLATASAVYALERPGDRIVDHLQATHYPGLTFADRTTALDWLFAEADCLLACAQQSAAGATLRRAADLLLAAQDLAESGANSRQCEMAAAAVRDAARSAGDRRAEGRARTALSIVYIYAMGRYDRADEEARQAMQLADETGDPVPSSYSSNDRGVIAAIRKRYQEAEEHFHQALAAFHADGNLPSAASVLCNLSRINGDLGRTDKAVELARQGVEIYERLGLALRLANGRYALGLALHHTGRHTDALEQLREALQIFRESRQRLWEGSTHSRLAEVLLATHEPAQAASHAEQALALRTAGGEWQRGNVLTVLGKALDTLGQADRARACLTEALSIHEHTGSAQADEVRRLLEPAVA